MSYFIRSHYNYDLKEASVETSYVEKMPSLTVQSMSEDADLNIMLKRFGVTGKMPDVVRLPSYGDFSGVTDFRSAMDAIIQAEDDFMSLPADVRAKFENNPQLMLDFVENPANIEQVKDIFGEKNVAVRDDGKASASVGGASGSAVASGDGGSRADAPSGK